MTCDVAPILNLGHSEAIQQSIVLGAVPQEASHLSLWTWNGRQSTEAAWDWSKKILHVHALQIHCKSDKPLWVEIDDFQSFRIKNQEKMEIHLKQKGNTLEKLRIGCRIQATTKAHFVDLLKLSKAAGHLWTVGNLKEGYYFRFYWRKYWEIPSERKVSKSSSAFRCSWTTSKPPKKALPADGRIAPVKMLKVLVLPASLHRIFKSNHRSFAVHHIIFNTQISLLKSVAHICFR